MSEKKSLVHFIFIVFYPFILIALPQDLEVFTDFEDVSGEGTIVIGQEPNTVTLSGFTVETLEDPALLHSGTKALTLGPGQEGRISSSRGIQYLQYYAGETTGGGRMELRGEVNLGQSGGNNDLAILGGKYRQPGGKHTL